MKGRPIDAAAVAQRVARHGLDWRYSDETGSTNADVLDHYAEHGREVIAFSEKQLCGRGRRGREWHSPHASNIYCSIGLLKSLPPSQQGLLSIVTGLALCRALQQSAAVPVRLKWPNDLLLDGRKLGGILIESRVHDAATLFFAIGFGVNVYMQPHELDAIAQPATCLAQALGAPHDRGALLCAAIDHIVDAIRAFDVGDAAALSAEFDRFDAFNGQAVEVIDAGRRIRGRNRGIAADGQLRLETENGVDLYSAAEISLSPGA